MRVTTQLALFFIAFNLLAHMFLGLGIAGELGINMETGRPDAIDKATDKDQVSLGNGVGGTLFGMYNILTNQVGVLVNTIAPGFAMLKLFLPAKIVDPFALLAGTFSIVDLLSYARGFSL